MRVEVELAEAGGPPPVHRRAAVATAVGRRRIDGFDLAVLAALAAFSIWVLALDLWQVVAHGRVWTGTDGFFVVDQMQYLAWIRDASHHVLASNLFVLRSTPSDYFQPAIAISGLVSALGVAPWLALLMWKPVAVAAIFFAVRAYVRRAVAGQWARRAALVLALFFGSFTIVYGAPGVIGDMLPGFLTWGYPFGLMALAAMIAALVSYDRARSGRGLAWAPPLLGALASLLHPWQGAMLIAVVVGAELVRRHDWERAARRLWLPAVTVIATAVPLLYYVLLGKLDSSWGLAREASRHSFPLWAVALALAPLAVLAALGYRGRARSFLDVATRTWPVAAVGIYFLSGSDVAATPLHAFVGITVPLSILAVDGVRRAGWDRLPRPRLVAALAIAAVTIPATAYELSIAHEFMAPTAGNANFITSDERAALDYLSNDRQSGGVLTRFYLGAIVPAETGRRTYVGNCLWSEPGCTPRAQTAQTLFDGALPAAAARTFVQSTGARFVLADCQTRADLAAELAPMLASVSRFGCATVYELDRTAAPGRRSGALAESPAHAVVRAPRRQ